MVVANGKGFSRGLVLKFDSYQNIETILRNSPMICNGFGVG